MSRGFGADVIVSWDDDHGGLLPYLQGLVEAGGTILKRLIVVADAFDKPIRDEIRFGLTAFDGRAVLLESATNESRAAAWNRALGERGGDVVLLLGGCTVGLGWLEELAAVAQPGERICGAVPLSDGANGYLDLDPIDWSCDVSRLVSTVRSACAGLPRWTVVPKLLGPCVYLCSNALEAVGSFDAGFGSTEAALDDWLLRAQSLGLFARRANHVLVAARGRHHLHGATGFRVDRGQDLLEGNDPHLGRQLARFRRSPDARMPAYATRLEGLGKLRVALDLRDLPPEQVGSRTYAVNLARALVNLPEIELSLLVQNPAQARGMNGRVVISDVWADDVAVIHKPAQVMDPAELRLLFESSAHLVMTYQDLIAFRIPLVFSSDTRFDRYRATSRLVLPAVQRLIAYSESVSREIAAEFGIPQDEIPVVMLAAGDDGGLQDQLGRPALRLPRRYFFSLASDYPHKNLPNLLDAYGQFRTRWKQGEPPQLVLAGYSSGARTGLYPQLELAAAPEGVIFLGSVSAQQLRALYRQAEALVFASLYEGFGLPPLEAMAAGTPVIAMPVSAMREVGGDGVLYSDGLSATALSRAMERVACQENLRDELREKGYKRAQDFHWEKTARETFAVYRSAVLCPSERSLRMRRLLRDAIIHWSEKSRRQGGEGVGQALGIRDACRALESAVRTRLRRELRRLRPMSARKT